MEAFSDMKTPAFVINPQLIDQNLKQLMANDRQQTEADKQTRACYNGQLLWVDKFGVDEKADTLLNWLHKVGEIGLTERSFGVGQIEKDLERMRTLAFDDANPINLVAARLDYQLTKNKLKSGRHKIGELYFESDVFTVARSDDERKRADVSDSTSEAGL